MTRLNSRLLAKTIAGFLAIYVVTFWGFVYFRYQPFAGSDEIPFTYTGFTDNEDYRSPPLERSLHRLYYPLYMLHRACGVKVFHLDEPFARD